MNAVALTPGTSTLRLAELPEPGLSSAEEVKIRVLSVGICGTDREQAAGGHPRLWARRNW